MSSSGRRLPEGAGHGSLGRSPVLAPLVLLPVVLGCADVSYRERSTLTHTRYATVENFGDEHIAAEQVDDLLEEVADDPARHAEPEQAEGPRHGDAGRPDLGSVPADRDGGAPRGRRPRALPARRERGGHPVLQPDAPRPRAGPLPDRPLPEVDAAAELGAHRDHGRGRASRHAAHRGSAGTRARHHGRTDGSWRRSRLRPTRRWRRGSALVACESCAARCSGTWRWRRSPRTTGAGRPAGSSPGSARGRSRRSWRRSARARTRRSAASRPIRWRCLGSEARERVGGPPPRRLARRGSLRARGRRGGARRRGGAETLAVAAGAGDPRRPRT